MPFYFRTGLGPIRYVRRLSRRRSKSELPMSTGGVIVGLLVTMTLLVWALIAFVIHLPVLAVALVVASVAAVLIERWLW